MFLRSSLRLRQSFSSKVVKSADEAVKGVKDGHTILIGGFGICGIAMNLIHAVSKTGVQGLRIVSNTAGIDNWGTGLFLRTPGMVKRIVASYIGENKEFERQYLAGELELELTPQGTLVKKITSGGAGIPAFYTATGVDTLYSTGQFPIKFKKGSKQVEIMSKERQTRVFNNRKYVLEESIFADFALIKAYKADKKGNLIFRETARNFNENMATAAKTVVVECEQLVEIGELNPNQIHVPGVFIDKIFKADKNSEWSEKKLERPKFKNPKSSTSTISKDEEMRLRIAGRAAKEIKDGMSLNLGIGIPTLIPSILPPQTKIDLHSENGIMGVGEYPIKGQEDPDLINAGKESVTAKPGAAYFSSDLSFDIVRGGHLDLTILGALEVSINGDIANWIVPGKMVKGMGGAMDLVACQSKVIVAMEHSSKNGPKLLEKCTLPLTAKGVVSMVVTEKAVFQNRNGRLVLTEIASDSSLEDVQAHTGFKLEVADNLKSF